MKEFNDIILCEQNSSENGYCLWTEKCIVYSPEELCFYLRENIYLLDDTVCDAALCDWLEEEFGLGRLAQSLRNLLQESKLLPFLMMIFEGINYFSNDEIDEMKQLIQHIQKLPESRKKMVKADAFIRDGKYRNALKECRESLKCGNMVDDASFYAEVWQKMGIIYSQLFLYEESENCFQEAYKQAQKEIYEKQAYYAVYLGSGEEGLKQYFEDKQTDNQMQEMILKEIENCKNRAEQSDEMKEIEQLIQNRKKGKRNEYERESERLLEKWKREYRENAGKNYEAI